MLGDRRTPSVRCAARPREAAPGPFSLVMINCACTDYIYGELASRRDSALFAIIHASSSSVFRLEEYGTTYMICPPRLWKVSVGKWQQLAAVVKKSCTGDILGYE